MGEVVAEQTRSARRGRTMRAGTPSPWIPLMASSAYLICVRERPSWSPFSRFTRARIAIAVDLLPAGPPNEQELSAGPGSLLGAAQQVARRASAPTRATYAAFRVRRCSAPRISGAVASSAGRRAFSRWVGGWVCDVARRRKCRWRGGRGVGGWRCSGGWCGGQRGIRAPPRGARRNHMSTSQACSRGPLRPTLTGGRRQLRQRPAESCATRRSAIRRCWRFSAEAAAGVTDEIVDSSTTVSRSSTPRRDARCSRRGWMRPRAGGSEARGRNRNRCATALDNVR